MTKKLFLTLVSAVFFVLMLAACGNNDKNKEESENTDIGDTDTAAVPDTDPADTGDTETVPDEEPTEVEDTEIVPDEDPAETNGTEPDNVEKDGCTIKSSFGTHSFRKDITDTCVKEAVAHPACKWHATEESAAKYITECLRYETTFIKKCKDESEEQIIECPDFIPESLKFTKLAGCDVYSIDPDYACATPCAELYFSTDNDMFHTVLASEVNISTPIMYIKSSGENGVYFEAGFHPGLNNAAFIWSEKAEDGTEIKKKAFLKMRVVDPVTGEGEGEEVDDSDQIPAQCEDYEDRLYTEGDLIPDGCGILICSEEGWIPYGNLGCYDECDPDGVLEIRYWDCPNGEELEWCICEEDEEHGSIWSCINRVDLTCPAE